MRTNWVNNSLDIDSWNTGSINSSAYGVHSYDSSSWGISSDDWVEYNNTNNYDYFGKNFEASSIFLFDSEGDEPCSDYCVEGTFYDCVYVGGFCECVPESCSSECLPDGDMVISGSVSTTTLDAEWTEYDTHYYILSLSGSNTTVEGSTSSNGKLFSSLIPDTEYELYVNGSGYYGCDATAENTTSFTTLAYPLAPDSNWDYWFGLANEYGEQVNNGITAGVIFFGNFFGLDEASAKQLIWIVGSLIVSVLITYGLAERLKDSSLSINVTDLFLGSMVVLIVAGLMAGWLPIVWAVILIAIIGVLVFKIVGGS
jgi:hypothetical protein